MQFYFQISYSQPICHKKLSRVLQLKTKIGPTLIINQILSQVKIEMQTVETEAPISEVQQALSFSPLFYFFPPFPLFPLSLLFLLFEPILMKSFPNHLVIIPSSPKGGGGEKKIIKPCVSVIFFQFFFFFLEGKVLKKI